MAHQRMLKAEFFTDYDVAQLPPLYRLFWQGLWTQADRNGVLEDKPQQLKVRIMPYDSLDPDAVIEELVNREFIIRYRVGERRLLAIRTWEKNQSVNKNEKAGGLPTPDRATERVVARLPPTQSTNSCTTAERQLEALPFLFPVPTPTPVPGSQKTAAPQKEAPPESAGGLRERLEATFLGAKGFAYDWRPGRDEPPLREVVHHGEDEIDRRWGIALRRSGFPCCATVKELVAHWTHYGAEEPQKKSLRKETTDEEFSRKTAHMQTDEHGDLVL